MTGSPQISRSTHPPLEILHVGLGAWGRSWCDVIGEVPEVEAAGWIDSNPRALADAPAGVPKFASLQEALQSKGGSSRGGHGRAEAMLVTTGVHAHAPIVKAALEAGMHVLVEKPFAPTLAAGQELVALAAERGLVLMVSQNYRFHAGPERVASLVREQVVGRLGSVRIDFRKRFHHAGDHPYRRGLQPLLLDMFVHHADLMRFVLGREPISVQCSSWNPPWSEFEDPANASMVVDFGAGLALSWRGSWESTAPDTLWAGTWEIEGEQGTIAWSSRGDRQEDRPDWVSVQRVGRAEPIELASPARTDRHASLAAFAAAVRTGSEPPTSGRDNLETLKICLAAIRSAEEGRRVMLSEFASD